jgi:tRNA (pseudouridine54-N1)-methyltransferase
LIRVLKNPKTRDISLDYLEIGSLGDEDLSAASMTMAAPEVQEAVQREFILRARRAPTTPDFSLDELGGDRHLEIVAHCVVNALFLSRQVRPRTVVQLVMDGPAAPPKTVRLESDSLGSLDGLDERSIWRLLQRALAAGRGLGLGEEVEVAAGVFVAKQSFEQLVRDRCAAGPLYYLRPGGTDIRALELAVPARFVFTDHLAMPRKSDRFLERLGARPLSVGPSMLFASQCIAVVHNELDRLEWG